METYKSKEEAMAACKEKNGFVVLYSEAEAKGLERFFMIKEEKVLLDLIRQSVERGVTNHYHECLPSISKIFFDIDLKVPSEFLVDGEVRAFCYEALGDSGRGEDYTATRLGYFQSEFEYFMVYAIKDAIVQTYFRYFSDEFASRNFFLEKPLAQLEPVGKQVYIKDLDFLFDTYRSSRSIDKSEFKISWHLVLGANEFCMLRSEQHTLVDEIATVFEQTTRPLVPLLQRLVPGYSFPFRGLIDKGVYKGSNLRLVSYCRESDKYANKDRKQAVQIGGEFIRTQRHLFVTNQCKVSAQMPHRSLIGCITRRDGTDLEFITRMQQGKEEAEEKKSEDYTECSLPIPAEQLKFVLGKIGVREYVTDSCRGSGHLFNLIIRDNVSNCPVCSQYKLAGYDLAHQSDRMTVHINTKYKYIRFSCFRIDAYLQINEQNMTPEEAKHYKRANKSIVVDYEGERYISEYDIGKGFYREDDTCEIPSTESDVIKNDPFHSTTIILKNNTLNAFIRLYKQHLAGLSPHDPEQTLYKQIIHQKEVNEFPSSVQRLYVKSHMGTGKTKQLFNYMLKYVAANPAARIYIVTFRITFAQDMMAKLNQFMAYNNYPVQFVCYNEIKQKSIDTQYLVVQIESLNRVKITGTKCGLLVLDESESIYEYLSSGLSDKEIANLTNFRALVRFSERVIAMDAYLQDRTIELTERFALNVPANEELKQPSNPALIIQNDWQVQKKYIVYKGRNRKNLWLQDIINSLSSGEKVVVPCGSALIAKSVAECLFLYFGQSKRIQVFTQDTNERQRAVDLKDVQNAWKQYDALIYSPTISAGISFEQKHYDRLFAYFDVGVISLETFFYMMGRVRNVSTDCRHILIAGVPQNVPCSIDAIDRDFVLQRSNAQVPPLLERISFDYDANMNVNIIKNDEYRVAIHNIKARNLSSNRPFSRFFWMIGSSALVYIRKTIPEAKFSFHLDQIAKKIKANEFQLVRETKLQENDDLLEMSQRTDSLSPDERMRYQKLQKMHELGLSKEQEPLYNTIANYYRFQAWKNKYEYAQQRLRFGSFKDIKGINSLSEQYTSACSQIDRSEVLELVLKLFGLNYDIINSRRFVNKCHHPKSGCICIKQPLSVVYYLASAFVKNVHQREALFKRIEQSGLEIKKLVFNAETTPEDCIKKFNAFLKRFFSIELVVYKEVVVVKHTDAFCDYLAQDDLIKQFPFSEHYPLYNKQTDLSDAERLYICDYNYFSLPENQYVNAIRRDLAPLMPPAGCDKREEGVAR